MPGGGACLLCRLPTLPLLYFLAPIPPSPFPAGRGRPKLFYARGFAPCIPGAWAGRGTGKGGEPRARRGACPLRGGVRGASRCPAGGVPGWLPAKPPFSLLFCAHPPNPLPGGKGEILGYFMQGASPLASPGLNLYGAGSTLRKQFLSVMPKTFPFNNIIEKSSGGSGGLFQESPSVF